MKFAILFLLLIFIFAVSITLGANNDQIVTFNYLFGQSEFRLSTLFAILFGSGFLLGWALTAIFYFKQKLKLGATLRRMKKLQKTYDDEVSSRKQKELTQTLTHSPTNHHTNS